MIQVVKDKVRNSIIVAALQCIADKGFSNTSIAEISNLSGISTGNIYRYFRGKEELFNAVIPSFFVELFLGKFRKRIQAYPIGVHPESIPENAPYKIFSDELLEFAFSNRLQVLILLEGSAGTGYESISNQLCNELTEKFTSGVNSPIFHVVVERLFKNFLQGIGTVLRKFSDFSEFQKATQFLTSYHLNGLAALSQFIEDGVHRQDADQDQKRTCV